MNFMDYQKPSVSLINAFNLMITRLLKQAKGLEVDESSSMNHSNACKDDHHVIDNT